MAFLHVEVYANTMDEVLLGNVAEVLTQCSFGVTNILLMASSSSSSSNILCMTLDALQFASSSFQALSHIRLDHALLDIILRLT